MYYQTIKGTHATERHVNRKKVATILLQYNNKKKIFKFCFSFQRCPFEHQLPAMEIMNALKAFG